MSELIEKLESLVSETEVTEETKINEDVDQENEDAENKRKLRIHKKACEALEELNAFFEDECVDPLTGKMPEETEALHDRVKEMINEIYSLSLAFES